MELNKYEILILKEILGECVFTMELSDAEYELYERVKKESEKLKKQREE